MSYIKTKKRMKRAYIIHTFKIMILIILITMNTYFTLATYEENYYASLMFLMNLIVSVYLLITLKHAFYYANLRYDSKREII